MFGIFHDAGYKGLYGGLGNDQIKARKGVPAKEQLMDRMNATELAANQSRMTQTRDKLAREGIRAHEQVGKEIRCAIERIGGERPENIPVAEHIKEVKKRIQAAPPALLKAHHKLDAAVDRAYGKTGFKSDAERVAFLFERYQALTSLLPAARPKWGRKEPAPQ